MNLEDYLSLFPGSTREKQRFMALATYPLRGLSGHKKGVNFIIHARGPEKARITNKSVHAKAQTFTDLSERCFLKFLRFRASE